MVSSRSVAFSETCFPPGYPEVRYSADYYLLFRELGANGEPRISRSPATSLPGIRVLLEERGWGGEGEVEIRSNKDGTLIAATGGRWTR